jgi:hypothetical protein
MAILKDGLEILPQAFLMLEGDTNEPKELTARLSAARKVRARNAFIVAAASK